MYNIYSNICYTHKYVLYTPLHVLRVDSVGTRLGLGWDSVGTRLGLGWGSVGTRLGLGWNSVGTRLGRGWDAVGTRLGLGWDAVGTRLGLIKKPVNDSVVVSVVIPVRT